jgi:hypothetical protein
MVSTSRAGVRLPRVWLSPVVWLLLLVAAVNTVWSAVFVFNYAFGDRQYVFPAGLYALLAPLLTIRGVDLTFPVVLVYNLSLAVAPLGLLIWPSARDWCERSGASASDRLTRHRASIPMLVAATLATVAVLILIADQTRLPFVQERVRWATDWFPLPTPIENPLFVRYQYILASVLDARFSFLLGNAVFYAILFGFLIDHFGASKALPVGLAMLGVIAHFRFVYFLNGAEAELPAAILGLVGFFLVARRELVGGLMVLTIALMFKPTAIYYAISAGLLVLWWLIRREIPIRRVPWRLAMTAVVALIPFYIGFAYYVVLQRGGTYIFDRPSNPFFVQTASIFLNEFLTVYPAQVAVALFGLVVLPKDRGLLTFLVVSLFLTRSTYTVGGGYYTVFFLPVWVLLAARCLIWLQGRISATRPRAVAMAAVFVLLVAGSAADYLVSRGDLWVNRSNTHWDQLIANLREEIPPGATVYFRKLSPRYDLVRSGRRDLRFFEISEDRDTALTALAAPGPILYMAPYVDLDGPDGPLKGYGYQEVSPPLGYRDVYAASSEDKFRIVVLLKR